MKLTADQLAQFEREGYLFLPRLFCEEEMELLAGELEGIFAQDRPEVIREKGSASPRSAFYVQTWNPVFALLARHPRLVEPGMQILGSDKLYMHQFKINAKAAFDGAVWQWHQDYATWFNDDDMPAPRAMNIALFLAEANEFNGPLMFIPKSHRRGRLEAGHDVDHHQLSALDHRQRDDRPAGGGRRHRRSEGPARLDPAVPRQPGACLGIQPDALVALDSLPVAEPVRQRDPPLQAADLDRQSGFHAHPDAAGRLPDRLPANRDRRGAVGRRTGGCRLTPPPLRPARRRAGECAAAPRADGRTWPCPRGPRRVLRSPARSRRGIPRRPPGA